MRARDDPLANNAGGEDRRYRLTVAGIANLHKRAHVRLAEHQADIGMGNQIAVSIDHIGPPRVPDMNGRNELRDEREIDIGDGDTAMRRRLRVRDGHMWLGPDPEIGSAEV